MLHELQISPLFNVFGIPQMYDGSHSSKLLSCYLLNRSKSDIGLLVKSL